MVKLLSIITLILAIVLFPPAVLAFISNEAVPGDATYPIKRSLENIIITVASVNPVTRAWFAATRSNRRFDETVILVDKNISSVSKSLDELVTQTEIAAKEIEQVKDEAQKQKLKNQLVESINQYNQKLSEIKVRVENQTATNPAPAPASVVSPTSEPAVSNEPVASNTPTPIPQVSQAATPAPATPPGNQDGLPEQISDTQDRLGDIGNRLQTESQNNGEENQKKGKEKEEKSNDNAAGNEDKEHVKSSNQGKEDVDKNENNGPKRQKKD